MSRRPNIFAHCAAGCKWEVPHKADVPYREDITVINNDTLSLGDAVEIADVNMLYSALLGSTIKLTIEVTPNASYQGNLYTAFFTADNVYTNWLIPTAECGFVEMVVSYSGSNPTKVSLTLMTETTNIIKVKEIVVCQLGVPVFAMTGATDATAGKAGTVPAPAAGDQDKVLFGDGTWRAVSFTSDETVTYTVKHNATNVYIVNAATSAAAGSSYATMLQADNGYSLDTVTVTMGGTDITASAYLGNTDIGEVSIENVTGDIVITATAVAIEDDTTGDDTTGDTTTHSVTFNLTNCNSDQANITQVEDGESLVAAFSADDGYIISNCTVKMGLEYITSEVWSESMAVVNIPAVTGDVVIIITAVPEDETKTHSVTCDFANCYSNQNITQVEDGKSILVEIRANDGYTINTVAVTMDGVDVTSSAWYEDFSAVNIAAVTGDVVITATAIKTS